MHFPFCRHLCNYCDFYKKIGPSPENLSEFHQYLLKSFLEHKKLLTLEGFSFEEIETLYLGGGTPSLWGLNGVQFLKKFFKENGLVLSSDGEHTMEVNPGSWNEETLESFRAFGINRYSVGLQSLNEKFLTILDRVHNIKDSYKLLERMNLSKANYSVDFMLGLPFSKENKRNVTEELNRALDYSPSHLSLYILTTKGNYIHQDGLPSDELVSQEYLEVSNLLKERGFLHYEVSNFSLPKKESRHNLKYWKSESVAALGPSATGYLRKEDEGIRYKWAPKGDASYSVERLTKKEMKLEEFYLLLRTHIGIRPEEFFDSEELESFNAVSNSWVERGLAAVVKDRVIATSKGLVLMDFLMDDVFRFSKSF